MVGTRTWDTESQTGLRLTWANEFRLMHARVLSAIRNETPDASVDDAWDVIAKTVHWLFHKQPAGGPRFEVESPTSLAKKWDRIQTARRRQRAEAAKPARAADGRPDPQSDKEFTRW